MRVGGGERGKGKIWGGRKRRVREGGREEEIKGISVWMQEENSYEEEKENMGRGTDKEEKTD